MPACFPGDDGHRSRPAKRIKHDVAARAVELNEPMNQLLGEWGQAASCLCFRPFSSGLRRVESFWEWLPPARFRGDLPETVGEFNELVACDIGVLLVSFERPRAFGEHEHVFPTRDDVRIAGAFPGTPDRK